MELHTIGIDLGKTVFHLVGLDLRGEVVVRKKFSRTQLLRFTANVHVGLIGMEACGGSHFLGRALREQRHEVRLIPAQYVKPYVKTNKSDYFHKGREFAAWMGVVPREHSTGGQQKLIGISKRGNSYLRRLFVQGARAVLQQRTKQSSGLSAWLAQLTSRTHRNVAAVALANKLARIAWAVLAKNEQYRPSVVADVAAA